MNNAISRGRGRLRRAPLRPAVLLAAVTGGVMLAAGCSGPAHSEAGNNGGKTPYQRALAITQCMRQHGDPSFPDPGSSGAFPASAHDNESSPSYQAAAKACKGLPQPNAGGGQFQQGYQQLLKYSACMRSHGITNFSDPVLSDTGVAIQYKKGTGPGEVDTSSSQFQAAEAACRSLQPGGGQHQQAAGGGGQ